MLLMLLACDPVADLTPPPAPSLALQAATEMPLRPPNITVVADASFTPTVTIVLSPTATATETRAPTHTPTTTPNPTSTKSPTPTITITPEAAAVQYFFPVQPPEVASYSQGHHDYPATDIFAPAGSDFVAVTSGRIDFVSYADTWDPEVDDPATRGGLSVAIVGSDGIRYYGSHLSEIAIGIEPGLAVAAGQLLGRIGSSGNARFVPSHLHFGISHPTFAEDWFVRRGELDPYPYLIAWASGETLTPVLP